MKSKNNPYLICNKCEGYYELQPGEKPDDFDLVCDCGGTLKLKYPIKSNNESKRISESPLISNRVIGILLGTAIIILISKILTTVLELPCIFFFHSSSSGFLLLTYSFIVLVAGFITCFIGGSRYIDAIFNGTVTGFLGTILSFYFAGYGEFMGEDPFFFTSFLLIFIITTIILCSIGGIIGIYLKKEVLK